MEFNILTDYRSKYPEEDIVIDGVLTARVCRKCGEEQPISVFKKRGPTIERVCRSCQTSASMDRYNNEPMFRLRMLFAQRKKFSKRNGWPFTIDFEFVRRKIEAGYCEATGLPFDMTCDYRSPFFPSFDQIEPQGGYTPENTRVVVAVFNFAKNIWRDEDVLTMARALVAKHQDL